MRLGVGLRLDNSQILGSAPAIFRDLFNRADNPSVMGSPWTVISGTWGIISSKAYKSATDTLNELVVVPTQADCMVSVTVEGTVTGGLCCRVIDNNNHFIWQSNLGAFFRRTAGAYTALALGLPNAVHGDRLSIRMTGTTITPFINGVSLGNLTSSQGQTEINHGLASYGSLLRFDNFEVVA